MSDKPPLSEQEKADLVAYLDGELGGEAARAVEARISLDPAVRAEAEALKRTWDLLDYLPRPEPSPSFTHRTLERLAPVRAKLAVARKSRPWLVGAGWAAAVLAAVAAGYAGVGLAVKPAGSPDQDLTRDLRVIENKRYYDHVDDLDYLKLLDQPDLFGDDDLRVLTGGALPGAIRPCDASCPSLPACSLGRRSPSWRRRTRRPTKREHNRRLLDRYRTDPDHYARLLRDLHAFQILPPEKQERMRQFDRDLHEQDGETQSRLWEVLEHYTDWMNRLTEAQQKRIEQAADRNERLAIVKELRENDWIARLPQADRDAVSALPEPQRYEKVAALRKEERQRRREWMDWANGLKGRPNNDPNARPPHPAVLPQVPNRVLAEFARNELTRQDRAALHLLEADKAEWHEIVKQEYFKRHPEMLQKYRRK